MKWRAGDEALITNNLYASKPFRVTLVTKDSTGLAWLVRKPVDGMEWWWLETKLTPYFPTELHQAVREALDAVEGGG